MDINELIDEVNERLGDFVEDQMVEIKPEDARLDNRAAYRIYINDDAIAVEKGNDRTMQYYGGFEYVDAEFRVEMGDYIVYLAEDDRVRSHIEFWNPPADWDEVE